jgi:hypothetical protein
VYRAQHSKQEDRAVCPLLIPNAVGLSLYSDWSSTGSQFAGDWLNFDTGPGQGLTFAVWLQVWWGNGAHKNPEELELQAVKMVTH